MTDEVPFATNESRIGRCVGKTGSRRFWDRTGMKPQEASRKRFGASENQASLGACNQLQKKSNDTGQRTLKPAPSSPSRCFRAVSEPWPYEVKGRLLCFPRLRNIQYVAECRRGLTYSGGIPRSAGVRKRGAIRMMHICTGGEAIQPHLQFRSMLCNVADESACQSLAALRCHFCHRSLEGDGCGNDSTVTRFDHSVRR